MTNVGTKIRNTRKKRKLTLEKLARQVGISSITLHRIETGKTSPSVVLLSEIARNLREPVFSFFQEHEKYFTHIKRKDVQIISSPALRIKSVGPRNMIKNNIMSSYTELKKGKTIDTHTNPGIEWAYYLEGKGEITIGDKKLLLEAGDCISYNARIEHSITALEKLVSFNIYVEDGE